MAKQRYSKRTPKGNIYYQFKRGMRELMSSDPTICGLIDSAVAEVEDSAYLGTVNGEYYTEAFVTSDLGVGRAEDISYHGFVLEGNGAAIGADIHYGNLQLALEYTWVGM